MANYYVSSVAYVAVAQWAATHTYAVGAIVRQLAAPAVNSERCFRASAITTGVSGSTEPAWNLGNGATTADSGVTWTEITGVESHQQDNSTTTTWAAPAARINDLSTSGAGKIANGDTIYLSSDHAETQASALTIAGTGIGSNAAPCRIVSVSRTSGNVPPAAGDSVTGASIATTGSNSITLSSVIYAYGVTLSAGNAQAHGGNAITLDSCALIVGTTTAAATVTLNAGAAVVWHNTTLQVGGTGGGINANGTARLLWKDTPSAIQGTNIPTALFSAGGGNDIVLRGVDLSAETGTIFASPGGNYLRAKVWNCKLNAGATINGGSGNSPATMFVELVNSDSANTNYKNSLIGFSGSTVTETTITRTGGATDGTTSASRKMVSNVSCGQATPWEHNIFQWNTITGTSKTATVELISSGTLNNDDIWGELEYLADTGDCLSAMVNDTIATPTTTHAAQTSSTVAWNASPATPVKQKLTVSFTAQKAGLLHFVVKLAKASTTVYVDHLITVS